MGNREEEGGVEEGILICPHSCTGTLRVAGGNSSGSLPLCLQTVTIHTFLIQKTTTKN